ncbi:14776_t:CDS:2, partial [Racocetra fulgida]
KMQIANLNLFYPTISKEIMDSKLKIEIDTFDTSSRNNNTSNQPEVIVISDTDDELLFIGCQKYQFGQKGHRYIAISQRVNLEYLEQLFQSYTYCSDGISKKDYNNKLTDECFTVFPNSSTTKYCREY